MTNPGTTLNSAGAGKSCVSLFAGIGGFDLGFQRAGIRTVAVVEKDPSCRKLLAAKFPGAEQFDDVRTAGKHNLPPADIICGGFPCQDLSIAGKRAGLSGARSGLFYELSRIAHELQPAFLVWENVPGLLSADRGGAMLAVLVELARIGYHGGWRCLDAQYIGVAQRRRRIFGVFARVDLGVERCAEILSLQEGLRGHPAPRREAREGVAAKSGESTAGRGIGTPDVARSINSGRDGYNDGSDQMYIPDVVGALNDGAHNGGGSMDRTPTPDGSLPAVAWALQERDAKGADSSTKEGHLIPMPQGGFFDDLASPLCVKEGATYTQEGSGNFKVRNVVAFSAKDHGADATDNLSPTLRAGPHDKSHANGGVMPAVAFSGRMRGAEPAVGRPERPPHTMEDKVGTLDAVKPWNVAHFSGVRRLTPTECERLQGFPDGRPVSRTPRGIACWATRLPCRVPSGLQSAWWRTSREHNPASLQRPRRRYAIGAGDDPPAPDGIRLVGGRRQCSARPAEVFTADFRGVETTNQTGDAAMSFAVIAINLTTVVAMLIAALTIGFVAGFLYCASRTDNSSNDRDD